MEYPKLLNFLFFCTALLPASAVIETGQTTSQVLETLGDPIGTIELREKTLLLYPQGEVTLKEGVVKEFDLMSDKQFAVDQERLRVERDEWLLDQERRRVAHKEEGESLRAVKIKSNAFAALPAKDKMDYWRSFQIRYPSIDASEQIANALKSYETELEELRSKQRIAELETRVAQAEKEAAAARLETEKLRDETEQTKRSRNYGLRYYIDPVISNHSYYYRPPTVTIFDNGNITTTTTHSRNVFYRYNEHDQAQTVAEPDKRMLNEAKK